MTQDRLNLSDLKAQSPKDLLALAEELEIEVCREQRATRGARLSFFFSR